MYSAINLEKICERNVCLIVQNIDEINFKRLKEISTEFIN